ncbi:hypothetical protein EON67_01535 [archaeon]|nr:MAG: hypothetical protein EON67_01535 [archaeon]
MSCTDPPARAPSPQRAGHACRACMRASGGALCGCRCGVGCGAGRAPRAGHVPGGRRAAAVQDNPAARRRQCERLARRQCRRPWAAGVVRAAGVVCIPLSTLPVAARGVAHPHHHPPFVREHDDA